MIIKNTKKTCLGANWIGDLIFLTIILCAFFMVFLSARPLFAPDEGRYAEIAREMVQSGDYITPHLNYLKYFEKPVLFYWLSALAIKIGGLQVLTLRMVNAILGLIGCLVTYAFTRTIFNRTTGLLAAGILATSPLYFTMVHTISLDLPVTVFFSFSLYAYLIGQQTSAGSKRCYWFWTASAMAAFAVLTKGLIGIVFPVVIISIWALMLKDRNVFKHLYLPSCMVIFLLIAAPWHVLVQAHNPEFFNFYFIRQHFLRYTTTTVGHIQPNWFFIPCLVMGFFPWIICLPKIVWQSCQSTWRKNEHNCIRLFLVIWAAFIFIFFSFSKSKLIPYILPLFPALAILTADYLQQKWFNGIFVKAKVVFITLFAILGLSLLTLLIVIPKMQTRSVLPLANMINAHVRPNDEIVAFHQYYQDLPFYVAHRISVVNWRNELTFGLSLAPKSDWMINDKQFWQRFHSKNRLFVILRKSEFIKIKQKYSHEIFYILGETQENVLISNQK